MTARKNLSAGRATPLPSLNQQAAAANIPASTFKARARRARDADQRDQLAAQLHAVTEMLAKLAGIDANPPIKLKGLPPTTKEKAPRPEKPLAGGTMTHPETRARRLHGRRYILTSAQNNTIVHMPFLRTLERMAAHLGAEILVSRYTYNKSAWSNGANVTTASEGVWFAEELAPYLTSESLRLADDLVFAAEVDRLPTSGDPFAGMDSYTRESSGIFGHPRMHMRSMPVLKGRPHRALYSTGTITQRNYVPRLAGKKAEFHHTYGALLIEIDADGTWFLRQLGAGDDGVVHDLDTVYTPAGIHPSHVSAIVYGDLHAEKMDDAMCDTLWGPGGIRDTLRPEVQVLHDVGDFTARNHHNLADPFFLVGRHAAAADSVEADMRRVAEVVARAEHPRCITVVADANHQQQALLAWLTKADVRQDPMNKTYFHRLSLRLCEEIGAGRGGFPIYEWALRQQNPLAHTRFLETDESYQVHGIELGIHGHLGCNGAKGSPKGYRVLGIRSVTGHTHSAGVVDGVWTCGVSGRLDMGYNKGPSSWSHAHVVIYPNGKRAIVTMRGDRWRGAPVKPRVRIPARSAAS